MYTFLSLSLSLSLVAVVVGRSLRTKALEVLPLLPLPPPRRTATGPSTSPSSDSTPTQDTRPMQASTQPPWKPLHPSLVHVEEVEPQAQEGVGLVVESEATFTCSLTHRLALLPSRSTTWDSRTYEHNLLLLIVHHTFTVKFFCHTC